TPELISDAASKFGVQCVVAAIDVRREAGGRRVSSRCGETATGLNPVDWAVRCERLGAGEILLTSIDRDGTMEGYDLDILGRIVRAVRVPVIASGGAGTLQHLVDAVKQADVSAVAVGSLFNFTDQSPIKA